MLSPPGPHGADGAAVPQAAMVSRHHPDGHARIPAHEDGPRAQVRPLQDVPAPDWIEHRRSDGELVGWMVASGDGYHTVDLLGRQRTEAPVDWPEAEEVLETLGIGYLANRYVLRLSDGVERRVRISEVSTSRIVVLADHFGSASAVGAEPEPFELPFPAPKELRSLD